ncbi:MAG: sigma-70 family RNA polymerase sigma factor [Verrucomicrobiota bacterium]
MEPDDAQLLQNFCRDGSQEAFATLARRHAGLLYHVALRRTGREDLAEEAAQNTLAILARKAASLQAGPSLAAWLHRAVCFEASKLRRRERRHEDRMKHLDDPTLKPAAATGPGAFPEVWEKVTPHLDEALNELSEPDRQVVLLKYFEGWSFEEMARRLGGQSAAWRQRGSRAVERLRRRLSRRGVIVPLAVLTAGLGSAFTQSATAAVTAALTTAPLAAAASLSWKTLALHTLHTMNAKQLSLTAALAAALLVPLGFQAAAVLRSQSKLAALETTSAALRSAAGLDAADGRRSGSRGLAMAGAPGAAKSGTPVKEGIDLRELAQAVAEGRNADPLRILKYRALLASLDAGAIDGLLAAAETMDFPPEQRRSLYDRLLSSLADKDPALATATGLRLVSGLAGNEATSLWMNPLPNALRQWAQKDPAAARAWYAERMKADSFQNKGLGNADLDGWMASGLFTGLMWGGDRQSGMAFFETLDDAGKGISLRRFGTSNNSAEDRAQILKLAAGINDLGARTDALMGPTMTLAKSDLDQTAAFIAQAGLPAAETRKLLVAAATQPLENTRDVDVDARLTWLRTRTPAEQKDKALGYFLGDATFTDHAGIRGKVDAEIAAGASDAFLGAFIRNAAHRTSTMDIAVSYLPQLTDPAERTRTLREIQQGHTEVARAAALSAGVSAAELDAARQSR